MQLRFAEKFAGTDQLPVFALAQSSESRPTWLAQDGALPCFTTSGTSRLWNDKLHRWLTSREKAAASGLCVSPKQAEVCGVQQIDWQQDVGWHKRVGNGQQLPNVGLVMMAVLGSLKIKAGVAKEIFDIQPASSPGGLTHLGGDQYELLVGDSKFKLTGREESIKVHHRVHAS